MSKVSYDYDGTLTTGMFSPSPRDGDIVLTGRCAEEYDTVFKGLDKLGISRIPVYFNPTTLSVRGDHCEEARVNSGHWKASILHQMVTNGMIVEHVDDDPIQVEIIRERVPSMVVTLINNNKGFYGED